MITRSAIVLAALISAFLFVLSGCGGGGGDSSKGSLAVRTDWTNHATGAIMGQSEKITLFTTNGAFVTSAQMNQDMPGVQSIIIPNLTNGNYHLQIELFSARDLAGSKTGVLDALITISGSKTFDNAVGNDVTSVKVTPASAIVQASKAQQFYAAGYAANNQATFVAPGTISWQVLGGIGSVSTDGLFSAMSQGSGSVVATHSASGLQGAAAITVTPFTATQSKWTVMVFMNAANDLVTFSPLNMNQMEQVAGNPQVRFVVQWKEALSIPNSTFNSTKRYLMAPDTTNQINSPVLQDLGPNIDMGDKQTLQEFINWAKTFYPADHYCLVVWNHGNGWRRTAEDTITRGVSYDDETGNSIKTWELAQALGGNHFDIIAWDASLMQMMEVAYEIKDSADYIVGSEESPPGAGYPYHLVFAPFKNNPDAPVTTLSKAFVDGMIQQYGSTSFEITQSVIDTSKLSTLATSIDDLSDAMIANVGSLGTLVPTVRNSAQAYKPGTGRIYRDLWDVCDKLQAGSPPAAVATAAGNVKTAISNAVIWEGHNVNSPGSHGISIDFSSSSQFALVSADYSLLRFAADTSWNEWLTVAP
jgi:hypothetical protein